MPAVEWVWCWNVSLKLVFKITCHWNHSFLTNSGIRQMSMMLKCCLEGHTDHSLPKSLILNKLRASSNDWDAEVFPGRSHLQITYHWNLSFSTNSGLRPSEICRFFCKRNQERGQRVDGRVARAKSRGYATSDMHCRFDMFSRVLYTSAPALYVSPANKYIYIQHLVHYILMQCLFRNNEWCFLSPNRRREKTSWSLTDRRANRWWVHVKCIKPVWIQFCVQCGTMSVPYSRKKIFNANESLLDPTWPVLYVGNARSLCMMCFSIVTIF